MRAVTVKRQRNNRDDFVHTGGCVGLWRVTDVMSHLRYLDPVILLIIFAQLSAGTVPVFLNLKMFYSQTEMIILLHTVSCMSKVECVVIKYGVLSYKTEMRLYCEHNDRLILL